MSCRCRTGAAASPEVVGLTELRRRLRPCSTPAACERGPCQHGGRCAGPGLRRWAPWAPATAGEAGVGGWGWDGGEADLPDRSLKHHQPKRSPRGRWIPPTRAGSASCPELAITGASKLCRIPRAQQASCRGLQVLSGALSLSSLHLPRSQQPEGTGCPLKCLPPLDHLHISAEKTGNNLVVMTLYAAGRRGTTRSSKAPEGEDTTRNRSEEMFWRKLLKCVYYKQV